MNKVEHLQVVYEDLHTLPSNFPQNIIFSQESSPIPLPSFKSFPAPITQIAYPSLRFQLLSIPRHATPRPAKGIYYSFILIKPCYFSTDIYRCSKLCTTRNALLSASSNCSQSHIKSGNICFIHCCTLNFLIVTRKELNTY